MSSMSQQCNPPSFHKVLGSLMMLGLQMPTEFQRKLSSQAKEFWKDLEAGGAGIGKFLEIFFHRQKHSLNIERAAEFYGNW